MNTKKSIASYLFIIAFSFLVKASLFAQQTDTIRFTNDGIGFTGFLIKPTNASSHPFPVVVVLHYASMGLHDDPVYLTLAEDLNKIGYAAFIYDRRGSGLSGKGHEEGDYFDLARDAISAIRKLKTVAGIDSNQIGLFGISQGCWIAAITNTMLPGIKFQLFVSPSTMTPSLQMDYAANANLSAHGFEQKAKDSALYLRNIIDEYYRGNVGYSFANKKRKKARDASWYPQAYIFDLERKASQSSWKRDMDFDPVPYFKNALSPVLVVYGAYDKWVSIEKGIDCWNSLHLEHLTIKRVSNVGHLMIENEKEEPKHPVISEEYRKIISTWIKELH